MGHHLNLRECWVLLMIPEKPGRRTSSFLTGHRGYPLMALVEVNGEADPKNGSRENDALSDESFHGDMNIMLSP